VVRAVCGVAERLRRLGSTGSSARRLNSAASPWTLNRKIDRQPSSYGDVVKDSDKVAPGYVEHSVDIFVIKPDLCETVFMFVALLAT
jgi:hypothetical protein